MLPVDFVRRQKALFLGGLLVLLGVLSGQQAFGQGCSCPPINTCGCNVGLTKLTVQFTGLLGLTVDVRDDGGSIYNGLLLLPGSTFQVQSSAGPGMPFVGNHVTIRTTLLVLADISTSCSNPVKIGTTFGNFVVTGGESVGGLPICCLNMESTPPNFTSCPPNIDVAADNATCGKIVSWPPPTVTDNCGVLSVISDHDPGDFFPVGTTVVKYTATDNYGNTAQCSFNVRVRDDTPPVFAGCPANFSVPVNPATCDAVANWTPPTATDNCDASPQINTNTNPGTTLSLGPHTVTYTARDTRGNQSTCSFTVTVVDATRPVFSNCPANISVPTNPATCTATATWTPPTANDNCGGSLIVTRTASPGATFGLGINTVTYEATDAAGNKETCSFTVTVTDNTKPVFTNCPANIAVSANPATCDAVVSWTPPTVTDNCDAAPVTTTTNTPGSAFVPGVHTVTYEATDAAGNKETCSFTVTVTDNTKPVFAGCPANIHVNTDPATCDAIVNWTPPTATDNCDASPVIITTNTPGTTFTLGIHTITYEATDAAGNKETCSFTITVTDATKPVFSNCPANISVATSPTSCDAAVTWAPPTVTDNCDAAPVVTTTHTPGSALTPGIHTVTYEATDAAGNKEPCSFTVTVTDATKPVFTNCPANINVTTNPTTCNAVANWVPPTVTDNCDASPVVTATNVPGSTFTLGVHTVTYEATDAAGNKETCSFTITVTDATKPVFANCPANINVTTNPTTCTAIVTWAPPTITDNCDISPVVTTTNTPGSMFTLGVHTVIYEATDAAGNKETCSFTITVTDGSKPVFTNCPTSISVTTNAATCNAVVGWTPPTVTDNCDASPVVTMTNAPGSTFTLGLHTVTYEATDATGNKETCSFTITVTDATKPVFNNCPANINVTTNPTTCDAVATWTPPTVADNCDASPLVTTTNIPGSTFTLGVHTVTYEATDAAGNKEACSFTVTVTDATKPVFANCPANINVTTSPTTCDAVVTWSPPTVTDNCDAPVVTATNAPGSTFALGVHTVAYEATDASGNKETCSFTVTVTDGAKPVFTNCPANINITTNPTTCDAVANWAPPTVTDNCDASPVVTTTNTPGSTFALGVYTITYEATDAAGNKETCSFTVTVTDNTKPVFTNCPGNISVATNPPTCDAVVNWTPPTATDNCDALPVVTTTNTPGSSFTLGVHTVTYEATDATGNKETCSFTITVTDNTKPVFAGCPANINVATSPTSCDAVVNWTPPTVTDNCAAAPVVTTTNTPGSAFTPGVHTVTYEATDASGNKETCSFTITVTDDTKPAFINCPANVVATTHATSCDAIVTWMPPTVTDNCDTAPVVTSTASPGATFTLGVHIVTYEATDGAGNKETCSFTITVTDATKPVFANCPPNINVVTSPTTCGIVVNWVPPTVADNCDASPVVTTTHLPGSAFTSGLHTVTYEATDATGNKETCSFVVTVTDGTRPVFTNCPANINVTTTPATCDALVTWTPPTVTDNCDATPVVITTNLPGSTFTSGVHTVTYEATDAAGNKETCSFTVTVTDGAKPVFTSCPINISVTTNPATCDAVVSWTPPTVTDNCDAAPVITSTHSAGATFSLGANTITYQATDAAGNKETCSFMVTVTDGTKPVFANCPANISVSASATCDAVVSWTPPTVTDNCDPSPVMTSTGNPGVTFNLGVHTITYEATDAAGNKETCSFTVTVVDTTRPVFANCPADVNVFTRTTSCDAVVNWAPPTVTDNCDAAPVITSTHNPGATFALGAHVITYEATDAGGNKETCSFTITVVDDADPVFTVCPANIVVTADPTSCYATPSWTVPVASDNCTATPTVTGNFNPGDQFPVGTTTTVTYTAQDAAGNSATCSFTVTVNDNTAPVITGCPAGIRVTTDAACQAIATWIPPVAADNCPVMLTSTHNPGDAFPTGTTTVIYTATDGAGNVTTCSFDVIARDAVAPVFANCPGDITASASDTGCGASVRWTPPVASDNCPGIVSLSADHAPGDLFVVGTTTVTYTATDISGNSTTCSFTITVNDATSPTFLNCPGDIAVASDNACGAIVTWTPPAAADNCSVAGITSTHQPGDRFNTGTTEVIYTATDIHGNASACRFNVKVRNGEVPSITGCPADVLAKAGESGEVAVTWEPPTASTRCGPLTLTGSHQPDDIFPVGTTAVTYTASNDAGTTATCTFNVIVSYEDLDIEVTRVVTPDGDGKNDEWIIARIEKFNRNRVFILDRWGSVIYRASGYNNTTIAWNGLNSSGAQVPAGTYYYVIEVDFLEKHLKKSGFFELLR
jgi:gliding motility-associated-like protein